MDDTSAKLAALKKMREWMDQEEDERLRVTIDIDPNAKPADEAEDPEVAANEEKEAAEHPEVDPGTIHEIAKDHAAEGVDEADPAEEEEESPLMARLKAEDPADKEKRLTQLKKSFGGFSK